MLVTPAVKVLLFVIVGESKPCLESQIFSLQSSPPANSDASSLAPGADRSREAYLSRYNLCPSSPKQRSKAHNREHARSP